MRDRFLFWITACIQDGEIELKELDDIAHRRPAIAKALFRDFVEHDPTAIEDFVFEAMHKYFPPEPVEKFQCRNLINESRCKNTMLRQNIGDAFDYPHCESCQQNKSETPQPESK